MTVCELSVVIPCRNAMPWVSEQLDALARERPPFDWEVVLADNGSSDRSAEVARSYRDRMDITVLERPERLGAAAARNAAVAASGGRTLIFVDADDVIGPGYLKLMHEAIDHFGLAAARVDGVSLNPEWASTAVRATSSSDLAPGPYPTHWVGALGITRQLFDSVGGFDESFGAAEDADFCWRVQSQNAVRLTLCDAVLQYRLRPTPAAMYRQAHGYGLGDVQLYLRWREKGMARSTARVVTRRWAAAIAHLALFWRSKHHLARGLFLLGLSVGRLQGSMVRRVLYL